MRELIKKILREELSPNVKRRLNALDMDKLVNLKKQISFNPRMSVDYNVKNTIRKIAGEIYPTHNTFSTDQEYETSWDILIDFLEEKYSDELTEYFTKRKEEYENTPPKPFTYTFVKHDENNAGFSQSFPNLESLVYQMGDYLPILDWYEVKDKLDKIDYFPNNNFTGTYGSNRMLISREGDKGNNWGYSFSIIKSVPEEYIDKNTKKLKKNLQETIRRILREEIEIPTYIKRRYTCFEDFINKLENGEIDMPIIRGNRLDWYSYKIILTAYMRNHCGDGNHFYDAEIHEKILNFYEDKLYQWFLKNIPE